MAAVADLLEVGDRVMVDCIDGFAAAGRVVELRGFPGSRCKVTLADESQTFWAHDFELSPEPAEGEYDSRPDTIAHIGVVRDNLGKCIDHLERRQNAHDRSKLEAPEKPVFDRFTPRLKASTYGSEEYKGFLAEMKPALDHHYAKNSHHPEHYENGIRGMCLLDLVEMLADWKAATQRHADGSLARSIELNQRRFGYSDELKAILVNTASRLGWL